MKVFLKSEEGELRAFELQATLCILSTMSCWLECEAAKSGDKMENPLDTAPNLRFFLSSQPPRTHTEWQQKMNDNELLHENVRFRGENFPPPLQHDSFAFEVIMLLRASRRRQVTGLHCLSQKSED